MTNRMNDFYGPLNKRPGFLRNSAPEFYRENVLELLNNQIPARSTRLKELLLHEDEDEYEELVQQEGRGVVIGQLKLGAGHNKFDCSKLGSGAFVLPPSFKASNMFWIKT